MLSTKGVIKTPNAIIVPEAIMVVRKHAIRIIQP
jgi:hypothetical protein